MADASHATLTLAVDALLCEEVANRTKKIRDLERTIKEISDALMVDDGEGGIVCVCCFACGTFFEVVHHSSCPGAIANAALKKA